MLIIYSLIALGIFIMYIEPGSNNKFSLAEVGMGAGFALAWPIIAIAAVASYVFLAIAVRKSINERINNDC